jgi:hypothetical protein
LWTACWDLLNNQPYMCTQSRSRGPAAGPGSRIRLCMSHSGKRYPACWGPLSARRYSCMMNTACGRIMKMGLGLGFGMGPRDHVGAQNGNSRAQCLSKQAQDHAPVARSRRCLCTCRWDMPWPACWCRLRSQHHRCRLSTADSD